MTEKNTNDASSFSFNDVFKNANIAADVVRVTPDLPGEGKQVDPTRQQTPHPAEANQQPFQECRRENARVGSEGRGAVQSAERGERTPAAQKERRKRASVGQGNPRTPAERASAERASAERGERMPAERAQARRREDVPVAARTGTPRGQRASEMSGPDRNYQRRSRGVSAGAASRSFLPLVKAMLSLKETTPLVSLLKKGRRSTRVSRFSLACCWSLCWHGAAPWAILRLRRKMLLTWFFPT